MADNPGNVPINDAFKAHQSKAGRIGGRSKSPAKIAAVKRNLMKVRSRRHNPVTGPQTGEATDISATPREAANHGIPSPPSSPSAKG